MIITHLSGLTKALAFLKLPNSAHCPAGGNRPQPLGHSNAVHLEVLPKPLARLKPVQASVLPSSCIQAAIIVHDVDDIQAAALPDLIIVQVMTRCDLEGASAELTVHVLICNNLYSPAGRHMSPMQQDAV